MCLCHSTLSAYQTSLQRKVAVESMAMKSRHDPRIVGAKMKALSYRERERDRGGGRVAKNGAVYKLECELYWFA